MNEDLHRAAPRGLRGPLALLLVGAGCALAPPLCEAATRGVLLPPTARMVLLTAVGLLGSGAMVAWLAAAAQIHAASPSRHGRVALVTIMFVVVAEGVLTTVFSAIQPDPATGLLAVRVLGLVWIGARLIVFTWLARLGPAPAVWATLALSTLVAGARVVLLPDLGGPDVASALSVADPVARLLFISSLVLTPSARAAIGARADEAPRSGSWSLALSGLRLTRDVALAGLIIAAGRTGLSVLVYATKGSPDVMAQLTSLASVAAMVTAGVSVVAYTRLVAVPVPRARRPAAAAAALAAPLFVLGVAAFVRRLLQLDGRLGANHGADALWAMSVCLWFALLLSLASALGRTADALGERRVRRRLALAYGAWIAGLLAGIFYTLAPVLPADVVVVASFLGSAVEMLGTIILVLALRALERPVAGRERAAAGEAFE